MKKILHYFQITFMLSLVVFANLHPKITNNEIVRDSYSSDHPLATEQSTTNVDESAVLPAEDFVTQHDLLIKAINPGYTVSGTRNVGEFVELQKTIDTSISLAGYSLQYVNTSNVSTTLLDFSEGSFMAGESLLLRLARRSGDGPSDATYTTTIAASSGTLRLLYDGVQVDEVCWGKSGCYKAFDGDNPTTLLRDFDANTFSHDGEYQPAYDPDFPSLILSTAPPDSTDPDEADSPSTTSACYGLAFTEILSYYATSQTEQFIELYNSTDHTISLSGCQLRYKNKTYPLDGEVLAGQYYVYYPILGEPSFSLTKNPSTSNTIELLEASGEVIDVLVYEHGQKKGTSFALFFDADGEIGWRRTYALTPGSENIFQEFQTCPDGKVINPATGNCVKSTSAGSTLAACPEGKYRNPLTGRCKNIESDSSEPKPCAAGYERNPETNRCRKISSTNDGANYALVPTTYSSKTNFIAIGIVILIVSAGSVYIILQFRREIARAMRKTVQRIHHVRKNLIAWGISLDRHKKP